ncbi:tRNA (N6-isopentenyl adenosine(37)-C2)-methylthiotransferase MiaB [soil metagenome]
MKRVYLETFGCQMNVSDSERVASVLESDGFQMTNDENSADIVLLNTCSVREKAEHKLYTRVGQFRNFETKPLVGVLGCVAQLEGETLFSKAPGVDFIIGTKAVGRVSKIIEKVYEGNQTVTDLGEREVEYDWSIESSQRHSPFVAFLPIIEGCNKFCTYCIVPFSRGREKSIPATEIIRQVLELKSNGFKEIHLIGQNVNSYRPKTEVGLEKFHGATAFSRLLRAVAATGMERIKFTTSFPRDFHNDIVDAIYENENLCNWVHLPVQSGSNNILRAMRRGHTIENYFHKIDKIRSYPEKIALSKEIIIGFPGETDADFKETVKMAEYCKFDSSYIFKYSPRPGTPAFDMVDDVSPVEKTARFLELEKALQKQQSIIFQNYVGRTVEVLAEKMSNRNDLQVSGHSTCHKVINFAGTSEMLGKIVKIKITEVKSNSLFGIIV